MQNSSTLYSKTILVVMVVNKQLRETLSDHVKRWLLGRDSAQTLLSKHLIVSDLVHVYPKLRSADIIQLRS